MSITLGCEPGTSTRTSMTYDMDDGRWMTTGDNEKGGVGVGAMK